MKTPKLPLALLFACYCAVTVFAQNSSSANQSGASHSFTLEQVMSSPFPSDLTAARQAPRIAWVFDSKGERNVWTADAPGFEARQVTHYEGDNGQQIVSVRLTPDGRTVVFVRGSELSSTGHVANPASQLKEPRQQAWAAEVETGKTRLLGDLGCEREG